MKNDRSSISVKVNERRFKWGIFYFGIGFISLIGFTLFHFNVIWIILKHNSLNMLWACIWSVLGIGAGLINSRTKWMDPEKRVDRGNWYYFICFLFVGFISSVAAFITLLFFKHSANTYILAYAISAFVGITFGFTVDSLPGKIAELTRIPGI